MNNINKWIIYMTIALFTLMEGVFAETKKLSEYLTREYFLDFVTNKLGWMDWVLYILLFLSIAVVIRDVGLKNVPNMNRKTKSLVAIVVSFMGVTGFMWTLSAHQIFPSYFVLFAGEIFVLVAIALLNVNAFKKEDDKFKSHLAWRIFIVLLSLLLINSYHTMLDGFTSKHDPASNLINIANGNNYTIPEDSLLGQMANLHINAPFVAYILAFGFLLLLFADVKKDENNDTREGKDDKKKKDVKNLKGLIGKLNEQFNKATEEFLDSQDILKEIIARTRQFHSNSNYSSMNPNAPGANSSNQGGNN